MTTNYKWTKASKVADKILINRGDTVYAGMVRAIVSVTNLVDVM